MLHERQPLPAGSRLQHAGAVRVVFPLLDPAHDEMKPDDLRGDVQECSLKHPEGRTALPRIGPGCRKAHCQGREHEGGPGHCQREATRAGNRVHGEESDGDHERKGVPYRHGLLEQQVEHRIRGKGEDQQGDGPRQMPCSSHKPECCERNHNDAQLHPRPRPDERVKERVERQTGLGRLPQHDDT